MNNREINNLVEVSLNPYLVFKIEILNTEEEYQQLLTKVDEFITPENRNKILQNSEAIDLTWDLGYVFVKQNFLKEYFRLVKLVGFKIKVTDATEELWDSNNLQFLNQEDPAPELTEMAFPFTNPMNILKQIFDQKYNQDDVIDKIARTGVESLNELNKYIINK